MKKLILALLLGLAVNAAQAGLWTDDYEAALAQAKAENRFVLLNFTGSDWCGWCIRLDKEVFSKGAFKDYAKTNLVLVTLDFPRKHELKKEMKERNEELSKIFSVRGFPTIILLNPAGNKIGQTGYQPGGPEAYVTHLEELLAPYRKPQAVAPPAGAAN